MRVSKWRYFRSIMQLVSCIVLNDLFATFFIRIWWIHFVFYLFHTCCFWKPILIALSYKIYYNNIYLSLIGNGVHRSRNRVKDRWRQSRALSNVNNIQRQFGPPHDKTNTLTCAPSEDSGILPVWSESSLCAQCVAKDPMFLHADSEDSDQIGWSESSLICWIVVLRLL